MTYQGERYMHPTKRGGIAIPAKQQYFISRIHNDKTSGRTSEGGHGLNGPDIAFLESSANVTGVWVLGLYVYDRRQCNKTRQEYIDKVKHFAENPVDPFDAPRRVTVYGAKWPGDEDYDQSLRHFRKYVKPILVAAAIDYNLIPGKRHGDIARKVAEEVRIRRREDLGLDRDSDVSKALPTYKPLSERRKRELEGGIVLVGRPTFKEFMAGLKRGWTDGLHQVDREEQLAHLLEDDSYFDEPPEEPVGLSGLDDSSTLSTKPYSAFPSSKISQLPFVPTTDPTNPAKMARNSQPRSSSPSLADVPQQPPILFVPFMDYIGFKQIPLMIWDFFNQRHKVKSGAEAAYKLVMGVYQPLQWPKPFEHDSQGIFTSDGSKDTLRSSQRDLDFDKQVEPYYNKSTMTISDDIEKARQIYYEALPKRLNTSRELARRVREHTKEELNNPPPTEVELRAERLRKEQRWRDDVDGWNTVRPSNDVAWDERFRGALCVFVSPPKDGDNTNS